MEIVEWLRYVHDFEKDARKGGQAMMNTLHLLWIVPLAASFGFALCALLTVAKRADN